MPVADIGGLPPLGLFSTTCGGEVERYSLCGF